MREPVALCGRGVAAFSGDLFGHLLGRGVGDLGDGDEEAAFVVEVGPGLWGDP